MLPDEFRKDKARVKAAAEVLATPVMREILQCLTEANPVNYALPKMGPLPSDHSRQLGMIEGHWYALRTLKLFGVPTKPREELKADFTQQG